MNQPFFNPQGGVRFLFFFLAFVSMFFLDSFLLFLAMVLFFVSWVGFFLRSFCHED